MNHHDTDGHGQDVSWYTATLECQKNGRPWKELSMTALAKNDVWSYADFIATKYGVEVNACIHADGLHVSSPIWRTFRP